MPNAPARDARLRVAPHGEDASRAGIDITNRGYVRVDSEKETVSYPKAAPVLDEASLRKTVDASRAQSRLNRKIPVPKRDLKIDKKALRYSRRVEVQLAATTKASGLGGSTNRRGCGRASANRAAARPARPREGRRRALDA